MSAAGFRRGEEPLAQKVSGCCWLMLHGVDSESEVISANKEAGVK